MMKSVSLLACATTFFAVGTASAGSLNDPVITPVTPAIEDLRLGKEPMLGAHSDIISPVVTGSDLRPPSARRLAPEKS